VVITGGASCPVETIRAYRQKMPGHLIELYGMLETGLSHVHTLTDDPEAVTGTIGRAAAGMGLRLIDADGRDVPPAPRERSPRKARPCTSAINKNPAANAELFTADGWLGRAISASSPPPAT